MPPTFSWVTTLLECPHRKLNGFLCLCGLCQRQLGTAAILCSISSPHNCFMVCSQIICDILHSDKKSTPLFLSSTPEVLHWVPSSYTVCLSVYLSTYLLQVLRLVRCFFYPSLLLSFLNKRCTKYGRSLSYSIILHQWNDREREEYSDRAINSFLLVSVSNRQQLAED